MDSFESVYILLTKKMDAGHQDGIELRDTHPARDGMTSGCTRRRRVAYR
jgi:hypothetical protein